MTRFVPRPHFICTHKSSYFEALHPAYIHQIVLFHFYFPGLLFSLSLSPVPRSSARALCSEQTRGLFYFLPHLESTASNRSQGLFFLCSSTVGSSAASEPPHVFCPLNSSDLFFSFLYPINTLEKDDDSRPTGSNKRPRTQPPNTIGTQPPSTIERQRFINSGYSALPLRKWMLSPNAEVEAIMFRYYSRFLSPASTPGCSYILNRETGLSPARSRFPSTFPLCLLSLLPDLPVLPLPTPFPPVVLQLIPGPVPVQILSTERFALSGGRGRGCGLWGMSQRILITIVMRW